MHFEIVGEITDVETIAAGHGIRTLKALRKRHGGRRWRKLKGNARVRLASGSISPCRGALVRGAWRWTDRLENRTILGPMTMKRQRPQGRFVLCVRNDGSEDLEPRKVYRVLQDREANREGYLRVLDESGEDYLYPAEYFVAVKLPASVSEQFVSASAREQRVAARMSRRSASPRPRASRAD